VAKIEASLGLPKIPAVVTAAPAWRSAAAKRLSAIMQPGSVPSVSSGALPVSGSVGPGAAPVPGSSSQRALAAALKTANELPGMPERSAYAPVAMATWFGFVSETITPRDSR
jgi:hypothetical protein